MSAARTGRPVPDAETPRLRLDKWLWHARFFKSRTTATAVCEAGRIRVNGVRVDKAHYALRPGDVLTFPLGPHIRVIRILDLGARRGPAREARMLYEDLSPPQPSAPVPTGTPRAIDGGRPRTKADRRALDLLRGRT